MSSRLQSIAQRTANSCSIASSSRRHQNTVAGLRTFLTSSGTCRRDSVLPAPSSEGFGKGERVFSTSPDNNGKDAPSLFDSSADPWAHVLENIDDKPPVLSRKRYLSRFGTSESQSSMDDANGGTVVAARNVHLRRQNMTEGETRAFNDVFGIIFNAVSEQNPTMPGGRNLYNDPLTGAGIGVGTRFNIPGRPRPGYEKDEGQGVAELLKRMRRHSRKVKKAAEDEELFEKKRERIERCVTDLELLEWACREVFGEEGGEGLQLQRQQSQVQTNTDDEPSSTSTPTSTPLIPSTPLPVHSRAYARTIALLMQHFRERFQDPHLALSIFTHAKLRSSASYVFGCTVPVYNELITTRWRCFSDLQGVVAALEEMQVNGVEPNTDTWKVAEEVRREVGDRLFKNVAENLTEGDEGRNERLWDLVKRIERLSIKGSKSGKTKSNLDKEWELKNKKQKRWNIASESWKFQDNSPTPDSVEDGNWRFGVW